MNVMPRDIEALHLVRELRFLTIEQADMCVYHNRNVAQRRLAGLETQNYLRSQGVPSARKGRPTKAYSLSGRKRNDIERLLKPWLGGAQFVRPLPEDLTITKHALELNSMLCIFIAGAQIGGLSCRVIPEHIGISTGRRMQRILDDEVSDPRNKARMLRYRRDAVCMIGTARGNALFEIEYDRGKEVIESKGRRKITIERKLDVFMQTLKEQRFLRYSSPDYFETPFKTSRLLIITTSLQRVRNIAEVCNRIGTRGMVYLATAEDLSPQNVFGPRWVVPDNGSTARKGLVRDYA